MTRLTEDKIILVVRATRMTNLKARFATKPQARFYVDRLGGDFADYEKEDATYETAIAEARRILSGLGRVQIVQRALLPNFVFGPEDIVVALGQDGLVANTLKYLAGQPLIGVNPDPPRWDGQLLPFTVRDLEEVVREVLRRRWPVRQVTIAEASLNTGSTIHAVNDFFIGARTHVSARYRIELGRQGENQSSSGVIVSTGLGSTGWLKSLLTGATAIAQSAAGVLAGSATQSVGGAPSRPAMTLKAGFAWDADYLLFTVREPFPTKQTGASLVFGRVTPQTPLVIESRMGEAGVISATASSRTFWSSIPAPASRSASRSAKGCWWCEEEKPDENPILRPNERSAQHCDGGRGWWL